MRDEMTDDWLGSLDQRLKATDLANYVSYSPAQFFRLVHRSFGDSPMAIRRRLLLERAAYMLTHSETSVSEVALEANYDSLRGFSRAFKRTYGLNPSDYRRLAPTDYRYGPIAGLHFFPKADAIKGGSIMRTDELMVEHHVWHMCQILDRVEQWSAEEFDRMIDGAEPFPWCDTNTTFRAMLGKACGFAAPWMHAISGIETPYEPGTIAEMRAALDRGKLWFLELLKAVEKDNSWDLTFVDGVCDPPEVFSYGGVIGHVLTHSDYRRYALVFALRHLGYKDLTFSDPLSMTS